MELIAFLVLLVGMFLGWHAHRTRATLAEKWKRLFRRKEEL